MSKEVVILKPIYQGKTLEKIYLFGQRLSVYDFIKECKIHYDKFDMIALVVNDDAETVRSYIIPIGDKVAVVRNVPNRYVQGDNTMLFFVDKNNEHKYIDLQQIDQNDPVRFARWILKCADTDILKDGSFCWDYGGNRLDSNELYITYLTDKYKTV